MKLRSILAAFTALLIGTFAVAASPPSESKIEAPAKVSSATSPEWSPNCFANRSVIEPSPFSAPRETTTFPCGPCSVDECQGRNAGDQCFYFGGIPHVCGMAGFCGVGTNSGKYCECRELY
jgi:hypothetical protein